MLDALQCPYCGGTELIDEADAVRCGRCARRFPRILGVVNTLVQPDPEVVRELQGMLKEAHEKGQPWKTVEELIVRRLDHVTDQREREGSFEGQPRNYFLSTRLNLEQSLQYVDFSGKRTILEIGGENEFPFLIPFRERGFDCYVTNISFSYDDPEKFARWPHRVAGDMNRLPFRDGYFDVVLASATTHHSPDVDRTIREIARVTKPGGTVLILNDPIHGLLKHLWERLTGQGQFRKGGERDELIHENEYSIDQYRRLFRKHGLDLKRSMFSAFYDRKLSSGDVAKVRWSVLARVASLAWRIAPLRSFLKSYGLVWGQRLIGLEMNVILEKT